MTQPVKKPLSTLQWWVCFGLATYVLSLCLEQSRAFFLGPNWEDAGRFAVVFSALAVVMLLMGYDSYVGEKRKGNVQKNIRLFDWLDDKGFLTGGKHE